MSLGPLLTNVVGGLYVAATLGLLVFGLNYYVLLELFRRKRRLSAATLASIPTGLSLLERPATDDLPRVTTQIAVYNELNVVERAMRAAAAMRYPAGRHEIQVLDDSTDETRGLIDRLVGEMRTEGHDIRVVRRPTREGYKGGALAHGLRDARGELVAVFDADFVPPADYLLRTVPFFRVQPRLGFLQARWGHVNREHSLLTRVQSLGLDGHFLVEQTARCWGQLFMSFNGTAGIWRKSAIESAGGWQWDTLTEDMDLSYRVQLKGWEAMYLPQIVVPAELPEDINGLRRQQFRWAKGSLQTLIKLLPSVIRADVPVFKKVEAVLHMAAYVVNVLMLVMVLVWLPFLGLATQCVWPQWVLMILSVPLFVAMLAPTALYATAQFADRPTRLRRILDLPFMMMISMGFALSNSRAVFEALARKPSAFLRTPKRGDRELKRYRVQFPWVAVLEVALGVYCLMTLLYCLRHGQGSSGPFVAMYAAGFLFVGLVTICHSLGIPDRQLLPVAAPLAK